MIKKAALPDRRCPCQRNMFRESLYQHSYPWPELKIVGSADEKMNVIGHHHVSADGDIANPARLLGEPDECRVHQIGREQFPPLVCTKCDEEQGIVSEDPPHPRRQFWVFAHPSFVAASLWEAQYRCSSLVPASPAGRRLQKSEYGLLNWSLPQKRQAQRRRFRRMLDYGRRRGIQEKKLLPPRCDDSALVENDPHG